jgi:hypothetical protein
MLPFRSAASRPHAAQPARRTPGPPRCRGLGSGGRGDGSGAPCGSSRGGGGSGGGARGGGGSGGGGGGSGRDPHAAWLQLLSSLLAGLGAAGAALLGGCRPAAAAAAMLPAYTPEELERLSSMPATT